MAPAATAGDLSRPALTLRCRCRSRHCAGTARAMSTPTMAMNRLRMRFILGHGRAQSCAGEPWPSTTSSDSADSVPN